MRPPVRTSKTKKKKDNALWLVSKETNETHKHMDIKYLSREDFTCTHRLVILCSRTHRSLIAPQAERAWAYWNWLYNFLWSSSFACNLYHIYGFTGFSFGKAHSSEKYVLFEENVTCKVWLFYASFTWKPLCHFSWFDFSLCSIAMQIRGNTFIVTGGYVCLLHLTPIYLVFA